MIDRTSPPAGRRRDRPLRHAAPYGRLRRAGIACPGWTVPDLAHLGRIHRWVAGDDHRSPGDPPPEGPSDDAAALIRWHRGTGNAMIDLWTDRSRHLGVDVRQSPNGGLWFRRPAHEVGVHSWDLAAVTGTASPTRRTWPPTASRAAAESVLDARLVP